MQIPYDPEHLSPAVLQEIHYYMALTALRKLCAPGDIPYKLYRRAAVALAEKYRVAPYDV